MQSQQQVKLVGAQNPLLLPGPTLHSGRAGSLQSVDEEHASAQRQWFIGPPAGQHWQDWLVSLHLSVPGMVHICGLPASTGTSDDTASTKGTSTVTASTLASTSADASAVLLSVMSSPAVSSGQVGHAHLPAPVHVK